MQWREMLQRRNVERAATLFMSIFRLSLYSVMQGKTTADKATKRQALELYLEGLGLRSVGRFLKFSNVVILNWIRNFEVTLKNLRNDTPVQMIELDEIHSYVGHKKLWLDMVCC
jgi:transposase